MPKETQSPTFAGDVAGQAPVHADHQDGALVLTLDEDLTAQLGHSGEPLTAASVALGDGRSLLLIATAEEDTPLQVIRRGKSITVSVSGATEDDESGHVDDDVTAAFLILKQHLYERGELDLVGPLSAEDFMAIGAEQFGAIERLLEK